MCFPLPREGRRPILHPKIETVASCFLSLALSSFSKPSHTKLPGRSSKAFLTSSFSPTPEPKMTSWFLHEQVQTIPSGTEEPCVVFCLFCFVYL